MWIPTLVGEPGDRRRDVRRPLARRTPLLLLFDVITSAAMLAALAGYS
jgi:hypothetical protein